MARIKLLFQGVRWRCHRHGGWTQKSSLFTSKINKMLSKVEEVRGKQLLTRFQQQKFRHFFYHVLDLNSDHVISQENKKNCQKQAKMWSCRKTKKLGKKQNQMWSCRKTNKWGKTEANVILQEDFDGLNDRVRHYMDWSVNTLYFLALREVSNFYSHSRDQNHPPTFFSQPVRTGAQPFSGVLSLDCFKLLSTGPVWLLWPVQVGGWGGGGGEKSLGQHRWVGGGENKNCCHMFPPSEPSWRLLIEGMGRDSGPSKEDGRLANVAAVLSQDSLWHNQPQVITTLRNAISAYT